jgi:hypothetical protein
MSPPINPKAENEKTNILSREAKETVVSGINAVVL